MPELDKLLARIEALRAKTVVRGCTEAEALAAAAKVAELLDRHDLSLSDLERKAERCRELAIRPARKQRQAMAACVGAIAEYCDCRLWEQRDSEGTSWVFFGLEPSLEMARCVTDMVAAALNGAWARHRTTSRFIRHADDEKGAFLMGAAAAIADRLLEMKAERATPARGRDLIALRHAVVDAEFDRLGLDLRPRGHSGKRVSAAGFDAGQAAGAAIPLTAPKRQG